MQVTQGSLLIANPAYCASEYTNAVVYVTESTHKSVMGLVLNRSRGHDLQQLMQAQGVEWSIPMPVGIGGDINRSALVMLHTNEWYSSNTMSVGNNLSISSDQLMLEKLEMGNTPYWYKLVIGCVGWEADEFKRIQSRDRTPWLVLGQPSLRTIQSSETSQWRRAIDECSQNAFSDYI